jgi:hypothetical protein
MKGFVIAEQGSIVQAVAPVDITGGANGQCFSMKKHEHASILVLVGVSAAAFTKIILNACTAADGSNPTAIPFNIYKQETAGASHDLLGARTAVAAAGYTPSANDGIFYVIELDASELPDGSPFVQVQLTNGSNSVIAAVAAVLSGSRYQGDPSISGETAAA